MKGFTSAVFIRLVLVAFAVGAAFACTSYGTPASVALGTGATIAALAAAPTEVTAFMLCVVGAVCELVIMAATACRHVALRGVEKLAPDMLASIGQEPYNLQKATFGDESRQVYLELRGFPEIDEAASHALLRRMYDECRSLAAVKAAAAVAVAAPDRREVLDQAGEFTGLVVPTREPVGNTRQPANATSAA